jgi:hypothetical protein
MRLEKYPLYKLEQSVIDTSLWFTYKESGKGIWKLLRKTKQTLF